MSRSTGVSPAVTREGVKGWLEIVQSALTIFAILAAGWWFRTQRQNRPRLKIEHRLTHRRIAKDKQLLVVDAMLSNVGNVKLDLKCGKFKIYEILPVVPTERALLVNREDACNEGERVLEPGEGDQVHEEYPLDGNVSTVRVYTFFENPDQKSIGWELTSFYDLQPASVSNSKINTDATPSGSEPTR